MNEASPATASIHGTFLTFSIRSEEYGIDILSVKEIVGQVPITTVPGSPPKVLGVINLRGKVIPVLSMRIVFGLPIAEIGPQSVFIIVQHEQMSIGLVVDQVREVTAFLESEIEPPPGYGLDIDNGFVASIGKKNGSIRILLDIKRVLDLQHRSA